MANQSIGGHGSKFVGLNDRSGSGALIGSSAVGSSGAAINATGKFKGHQRRQSVARLLPDISKLRLLSWLVEASSELINCDIAIMDGVYAKLNRSRESLLFWSAGSTGAVSHHYYSHQQNNYLTSHQNNHQMINQNKQPPPMPLKAPVAIAANTTAALPSSSSSNSNLKISQKQQKKLAAGATASLSASSTPASKSKQKAATSGSGKKSSSSSSSAANRNHHSLPLPNYNATSSKQQNQSPMASTSQQTPHHHPSSLRPAAGSLLFAAGKRSSAVSTSECSRSLQMQATTGDTCDSMETQSHVIANLTDADNEVDVSNQLADDDEEDDDGHSSAASSTTSSGIHGGGSTSSSASVSGSSQSSSISDTSSCSLGSDLVSASLAGAGNVSSASHSGIPVTKFNVPFSSSEVNPNLSSAEQLSEKIRRTVMEHNYLQNLLVNVIRQHDRQRQSLSQQHYSRTSATSSANYLIQHLKIDLADIADSIDDGCLCACHSHFEHQYRMSIEAAESEARASTLPALPTSSSTTKVANSPATIQVPARKPRRLKKFRPGAASSNNSELSRQDIINQLGGKLCENCFETHYWLHGCSIELTQQQQHLQQLLQEKLASQADQDQLQSADQTTPTSSTITSNNNNNKHTSGTSSSLLLTSNSGNNNKINSTDLEDLNAIITLKNATFIKLIQQQVRSTISKSIELIDLIRKEIKSPESIKQKQLMKCFSTSIQLLTSVGNYVVPTQDISTFIPEVGLQQTTLFCLPPSDFDHLLIYPSQSSSLPRHINGNSSNFSSQRPQPLGVSDASSQYHLAAAPDIPIRRRANRLTDNRRSDSNSDTSNLTIGKSQQGISGRAKDLSADLQRLRTTDDSLSLKSAASTATAITLTAGAESSSGASSNNSSASSSIARGAVQQSSLIRAHTSSAILDNNKSQQQHDPLSSFEAIANLSRQHTEDDMLFQANRQNKFWQSSKFNFIKKLLHVKQQRLLRQQSKDRRIYNNKVQNKFRLVMRDLTHFNKSQQLLTTENGVNSLLTSMRNVLEFGLYLTLKLY